MFIFLSVCAVCRSIYFCCSLQNSLTIFGCVVVMTEKIKTSSSTQCSTKSEPRVIGECTRVHSQVFCFTRWLERSSTSPGSSVSGVPATSTSICSKLSPISTATATNSFRPTAAATTGPASASSSVRLSEPQLRAEQSSRDRAKPASQPPSELFQPPTAASAAAATASLYDEPARSTSDGQQLLAWKRQRTPATRRHSQSIKL